ncbi:MAG: Tex-like N-terminal domain-containing protein, partial [Planctomycetota bacterium]
MSENTPSVESVVAARVAERFKLDESIVGRALALMGDGLPIPYLARYRRDEAGGLDGTTLQRMRCTAESIREMEQRREFILRAVEGRDEVGERMRRRIERCRSRIELEYLYEPFRPPRKTPASLARERGLEPLADTLLNNEEPDAAAAVDPEKGVADAEEVLSGARDILAERFAVDPEVRGAMLRAIEKEGVLTAEPAHGRNSIPDRYAQFQSYEEKLSRAPSHRFLALRRAESESAISIRITFPEEKVYAMIAQRFYPKDVAEGPKQQLDLAAHDSVRLMRPAICEDALHAAKDRADDEAITVFSNNLADLLLYPPVGAMRVMGVNPAPRGAIPFACVDERGQHLENARLKLFDRNEEKVAAARETILRLVRTHSIQMVAVGNGQGRHACEEFLAVSFEELGDEAPMVVVVNEVGVGSYASGPVGRAELPALAVPVRGAVSLARRLMDPLVELVKVDARQIGVGQYQGDVDGRKLSRALSEVVERCVCWVGVDLNRAPVQQLACVCGLSTSVARSLVGHREKQGPFPSLAAVKELPFISDRAFELAGGFLRCHGGEDPLDATAVHPSHRPIVDRIAERVGLPVAELIGNTDVLHDVVAEDYADESFSPATVAGVLSELVEAGADPRPPLEVLRRPAGIHTAADLQAGMRLSGRVTNVTNFGAFVDLGVQQDGLVHVSELADRFVK